MKIARLAGIAALLVAFNAIAFAQKPVKDLKPTVILISLDGYRYDYLDKYKPPTLNSLAREGVRAKWMIPSFPTKTFPNHHTRSHQRRGHRHVRHKRRRHEHPSIPLSSPAGSCDRDDQVR